MREMESVERMEKNRNTPTARKTSAPEHAEMRRSRTGRISAGLASVSPMVPIRPASARGLMAMDLGWSGPGMDLRLPPYCWRPGLEVTGIAMTARDA